MSDHAWWDALEEKHTVGYFRLSRGVTVSGDMNLRMKRRVLLWRR